MSQNYVVDVEYILTLKTLTLNMSARKKQAEKLKSRSNAWFCEWYYVSSVFHMLCVRLCMMLCVMCVLHVTQMENNIIVNNWNKVDHFKVEVILPGYNQITK